MMRVARFEMFFVRDEEEKDLRDYLTLHDASMRNEWSLFE